MSCWTRLYRCCICSLTKEGPLRQRTKCTANEVGELPPVLLVRFLPRVINWATVPGQDDFPKIPFRRHSLFISRPARQGTLGATFSTAAGCSRSAWLTTGRTLTAPVDKYVYTSTTGSLKNWTNRQSPIRPFKSLLIQLEVNALPWLVCSLIFLTFILFSCFSTWILACGLTRLSDLANLSLLSIGNTVCFGPASLSLSLTVYS